MLERPPPVQPSAGLEREREGERERETGGGGIDERVGGAKHIIYRVFKSERSDEAMHSFFIRTYFFPNEARVLFL